MRIFSLRENNNLDLNIKEELIKKENIEYIISKAILALHQVLKNKRFSIGKKIDYSTEKFFNIFDEYATFLEDNPFETKIAKKEYFKQYLDWCKFYNLKPTNENNLSFKLTELGLKSKREQENNERYYYWYK